MACLYDGPDLLVYRLVLGPYSANCYLLRCPRTGESVVVDAPAEPESILAACQGVRAGLIIITHAHIDHIGALPALGQALRAPVAAHPAEAANLPLPLDRLLHNGDILEVGSLSVKVVHTPGHSPGSICLLAGQHLFSGDTLFPHGPGHTRNPTDFRQVVDSIRERLFLLPDDTLVYPGHGEGTVLGREKEEFANFSQRPWDHNLCGDVLWLGART
ncbi:MAG: MBL fold metallo-hydrolase [Chloroflexi bacterium]|nr:MBL fold metallo-hydrolase [Chloroflexota bacterium]